MLTLTAGASAAGGPAHVARVALRSSSAADDPLDPRLHHTLSLFLFPNGTTYAGVHTAHVRHEDEETGLQLNVSPRELASHKLAVACSVLEAATRQGSDGIVTYSVAGARVLLSATGPESTEGDAPQDWPPAGDDDVFVVTELRATNVDVQQHEARMSAAERQEAEQLAASRARRRLQQNTFPLRSKPMLVTRHSAPDGRQFLLFAVRHHCFC